MKFEESVRLAHKVTAMGEKNLDLSNYVRAYLIIAGAKGMIAHYGGPLSKAINGTQVLPILKKVQNIRPESPELLFGLGSFYLLAPKLAGGDLNSAGEYLKKTIEADPLFVDAYVRLAQFYKLKGDKEKYDFYINKAGEIDPQNELFLDIAKGRCNFICVE
jgi:tetratricopeptide (TPR) repeat protein